LAGNTPCRVVYTPLRGDLLCRHCERSEVIAHHPEQTIVAPAIIQAVRQRLTLKGPPFRDLGR
jgi:hypothetical protein